MPAAIPNGLPSPSIPPVSNGDAAHAAGPALQMIADPVNVSTHTAAPGTAGAGKGSKAAGSKRKVRFEERPGKAARVTDSGNPGRPLSDAAAQPGSSSGSIPNSGNAAGQPAAAHASSAAGELLPAAEPAAGLSNGHAEAMQTDADAAAVHASAAAAEAPPAAEPADGLSNGAAEAMQTDAAAAAQSGQADQATEVRAGVKPVWP